MPATESKVFDAKAIQADLSASDRERFENALKSLLQAMDERAFVPIGLPDSDCLDVFGTHVPDDMLELYLTLIHYYMMFEPTPTSNQIHENMIDTVITYGEGRGAMQTALAIQSAHWPEDSARHALFHICIRQFSNDNEVLGAFRIIDFLLDAQSLRDTVVRELADHVLDGFIDDLIPMILPRLTKSEKSLFHLPTSDHPGSD